MEGLTAGFGMGPGVSPPLLPPETCMFYRLRSLLFLLRSSSLACAQRIHIRLRLTRSINLQKLANLFAYALLLNATPYSITSHDFGLDLDGDRMKREGGGSEGVYVIRRGCADECFAVMRQI